MPSREHFILANLNARRAERLGPASSFDKG